MISQQAKKEAILRLLEDSMIMLHVDSRVQGVIAPIECLNLPDLRLNLSYRFARANIELDDHAIFATLTFSQVPFRCRIPFLSIYAVTQHSSKKMIVFREQVPTHLLALFEHELALVSTTNTPELGMVKENDIATAPCSVSTPALSIVKPKEELADKPVGKSTRAAHLRVIDGDKK